MRQFISVGVAADTLNVSQSTIKRLCDSGTLSFVLTPGGHRRICENSLREVSRTLLGCEIKSVSATGKAMDVCECLLDGDHDRLARWILRRRNYTLGAILSLGEDLMDALSQVRERVKVNACDDYLEKVASSTALRVLNILLFKLIDRYPSSKYAIGVTMEGEEDEIASRLLHASLCMLGVRAKYLGAGLTATSLSSAVKEFSPAVIWVSHEQPRTPEALVRWYSEVTSAIPLDARLVVVGKSACPSVAGAIQCAAAYKSIVDFLKHEGRLLTTR